jgi:hypothetical protein
MVVDSTDCNGQHVRIGPLYPQLDKSTRGISTKLEILNCTVALYLQLKFGFDRTTNVEDCNTPKQQHCVSLYGYKFACRPNAQADYHA